MPAVIPLAHSDHSRAFGTSSGGAPHATSRSDPRRPRAPFASGACIRDTPAARGRAERPDPRRTPRAFADDVVHVPGLRRLDVAALFADPKKHAQRFGAPPSRASPSGPTQRAA